MQNPILQMLSNGNQNSENQNAVIQKLMQNNPQFAQFMRDNRGKSPEQIAKEHGIDINYLNSFLNK